MRLWTSIHSSISSFLLFQDLGLFVMLFFLFFYFQLLLPFIFSLLTYYQIAITKYKKYLLSNYNPTPYDNQFHNHILLKKMSQGILP